MAEGVACPLPAPHDAPCDDLWAKTRAVRWVNESVPWPASPLDGALVDVTRFPYYNINTVGCDGAGYGCWFYLMRGAPAAINVGRSQRAQTRAGSSCAGRWGSRSLQEVAEGLQTFSCLELWEESQPCSILHVLLVCERMQC